MISKESALYGLGGGAMVALAFFLVLGQQDADRKVRDVQHEVATAQHQRDFARAMGWTDSQAEAAKDVAAAQERLQAAKAVADKRQAETDVQREAVLDGVRQDIREQTGGRIDLDAALQKLNNK